MKAYLHDLSLFLATLTGIASLLEAVLIHPICIVGLLIAIPWYVYSVDKVADAMATEGMNEDEKEGYYQYRAMLKRAKKDRKAKPHSV